VETQPARPAPAGTAPAAQPLLDEPSALRRLVEVAPLILWRTDRDLRFDWAGGGGLLIPPAELLGKRVGDYMGPEDPGTAYSLKMHARALAGETVSYELTWRDRSFDVSLVPYGVPGGVPSGVIGAALETTARRRDEAELRHSREQLRAIARDLDTVREEEQSRIARDIHDELGQQLAALRFDLAYFESRLPQRRRDLAEEVAKMKSQLDDAISAVREITADLRPPVLEEAGLAPSLEFLAKRMAQKARRPLMVDVHLEDGAVDGARAVAVYRLLQEALRNAVCHAGADMLAVHVGIVDGVLQMQVLDDGKGIRPEDVRATRSIGLAGMRERAALFDGTVDIRGVDDGGTTVTIRIPLAAARPAPTGEPP
jgi:signal transduction histidine kinase